jgi:hypothetical protein
MVSKLEFPPFARVKNLLGGVCGTGFPSRSIGIDRFNMVKRRFKHKVLVQRQPMLLPSLRI